MPDQSQGEPGLGVATSIGFATTAGPAAHPFSPITLDDATGENPLDTDWCGHVEVCGRLAAEHGAPDGGQPIGERRARARKVAKALFTALSEAVRAEATGSDDEDAPERLLLADVFAAAVPYVDDEQGRPLVLPLALLAQRMYRAAMNADAG